MYAELLSCPPALAMSHIIRQREIPLSNKKSEVNSAGSILMDQACCAAESGDSAWWVRVLSGVPVFNPGILREWTLTNTMLYVVAAATTFLKSW